MEYERPIVQTLGTRPCYHVDEKREQFSVYFFSGMVPLQRINSGVKVCPPDMHVLSSKSMKWKRMKQTEQSCQVVGRKNFAMSYCDDQIFVTGGMDNGQNPLSEFLIFNISNNFWQEMRQKRLKK